MIELTSLSKSFGTFTAVQNLSFSIRPGEVLGLVGPNGAGKTTTLRIMAGIIPPTAGTVLIGGHDIVANPIQAKRQLAFFPDEPRLFDYLTVRQHLNFVARLYGVADHESRAVPLLEELELTDRADHLPGELSRGMKQKLAIACGLLHSPSVLIFDEPLTGLDPLGIRRMRETIVMRGRSGGAVIVSSHLLHLVEEICTRIVIIDRGIKVADGTVAELSAQARLAGSGSNLEQIFLTVTAGADAGNIT